MIRLSAEAEPQIYATTRRFGTILENVVVDETTRQLKLDDDSLTENTRGAYPISFIDNAELSGGAGHPANILMLAADAFGVLPPISKLSPAAAMYHFLSGYTAKVAGTEKGVLEPKVTFSTCFGAPFLPLHPTVYAKLLGEKIAKHGAKVWLVNTGWTGGPYGVGHRMKIAHTRALISAALSGALIRRRSARIRSSTWTFPNRAPACRPTCCSRDGPGAIPLRTISRHGNWPACSRRTSRPSPKRPIPTYGRQGRKGRTADLLIGDLAIR
jgi:ATP-dependent phosphoenolpyruvate carboxykinase